MNGTGHVAFVFGVLLLFGAACGDPERADLAQDNTASQPSESPRPQPEPTGILQDLDCPIGDDQLTVQSDLLRDAPGGPGTAVEALLDLFLQEGMAIAPQEFTPISIAPGVANYVLESNGSLLASARIEKHGDSWYVTLFRACNSTLSGPPK